MRGTTLPSMEPGMGGTLPGARVDRARPFYGCRDRRRGRARWRCVPAPDTFSPDERHAGGGRPALVVLVTLEAVVIVLLAVLVAGLLRSHAEILRRLHALGAGLDRDVPVTLRTGSGAGAGGSNADLVGPGGIPV